MAYVLEQNVSDKLTIGLGKKSSKGKSSWICFDPNTTDIQQIEPIHASVSLVVLKCGTLMVEVHDLKSIGGTYVSNKRIPTGKKEMAFRNHSVRTGNVTFVVTNIV